MTPSEARLSIKNLFGEVFSLTPSALVTMFEIDVGDILLDKGVIDSINDGNEDERVFRFHNNVNLVSTNITWQGKEYTAAPIRAEGFEMNGRGTLATPRLSITVSEDAIPALGALKYQIKKIEDLVTAKVTRRRTLLKFLDPSNFIDGANSTADPNSEFPTDVYFVDRKSIENKRTVEYELASILDVEGIRLPGRFVVANRCVFNYRGEGCLYESENNRVVAVHGNAGFSRLPSSAPAVANEKDELISDLLPIGTTQVPKGPWKRETAYELGDEVYTEKQGIKYRFVAKKYVPENIAPPNGTYWLSDSCSKLITGCKLRWGINEFNVAAPGKASGDPHNGCLPYGGFKATDKVGR